MSGLSVWKEIEVDIDLDDCVDALRDAGYKVIEPRDPHPRGLGSEAGISPDLRSALQAIESVSVQAENVVHRTALVVAYRILLEELV